MIKLYGIKNCDSVKKAQKWLNEQQIDYLFHDYRRDGLNREQLEFFTTHASLNQLLNRQSTSWRQLTSDQQTNLTTEKAIQLMLDTPTLIKRPILEFEQSLIIGFNADSYAEFFKTIQTTKP